MANIELMTIASPPNTLFQGISTNYLNNLTYTEYLLGILKKMNELIIQVNSNTQFIENYDGRINQLELEMIAIRKEIQDFENQVNEEFADLQTQLINTINQRLIAIRTELIEMLNLVSQQSKAYTDLQIQQVRAEIEQILLGQIEVHDPTTGLVSDLQTVLNNIYDSTREEALTATEYDGLELTATAYDGYEITAFNYDQYGKTILTA